MKRRTLKKREARFQRECRAFLKRLRGSCPPSPLWYRRGVDFARPGTDRSVAVTWNVRTGEIVGVAHPDDALLEAYEAKGGNDGP